MTSFLSKKEIVNDPYIAFVRVDDQVSKPIVGNDGAFAWKTFINSRKPRRTSVAPELPSKRADRLQGFKNFREERDNEVKIRNEHGDVRLGEGYVSFKEKLNHIDIEKNKNEERIRKKIRPATSQYFIKYGTFEGKKYDYVFMTKDRGTGYYWDGMDSYYRLVNGKAEESVVELVEPKLLDVEYNEAKQKRSKTNKFDKNNAMEDIEKAIQRRNILMANKKNEYIQTDVFSKSNEIHIEDISVLTGAVGKQYTAYSPNISSLELNGWETAYDEKTKRIYYFHRGSGERRWDCPLLHLHKNKEALKSGWKTAKDAKSGCLYYYNEDTGYSSWNIP